MLTVEVRSDIVVVGQNSEMADYDNPKGYLYGFNACVEATDEAGYRWAHRQTFTACTERDAHEAAEVLAVKVRAHLAKGGKLKAPGWLETRPMYGSDAYIATGGDAEMCAWEKQLEEDFYAR